MILPSRRNCVRTVQVNGKTCIRKLFADPCDWDRELAILKRLEKAADVPHLLRSVPGILLMEYRPLPTLLDELERQEREGFSPIPWKALKRWLQAVYDATGLVPGDGNLRNFLWNASENSICGIDFEGYLHSSLDGCLAQVAAYVLEYTPKDSPVKVQAAALLSLFPEAAREALRLRRRGRNFSPLGNRFSFILMAGGASSRMGRDKADLPLLGSTLLELQLDKARLLGIDDILISGNREPVPGVRVIPDIYPNRGPLGGLHACLSSAKHPHCIVLGVDMPLLPAQTLRNLAAVHESGITLATHEDRWEPLAGVYDTRLHEQIPALIRDGGAPVRSLIQRNDCHFQQADLPSIFWTNCNTPESYAALLND